MPRSTKRSDADEPGASPEPAERPKTTAAAKAGAKPRRPRARSRAKGIAGSIRLTGDRLIVRSPENGERKTSAGLLIPATAAPAPRRLSWGDVQLTGPDVRVAKEGDRVLFLPSSALEVELDGADYVLLRERDVQAVAAQPDAGGDRAPGQYL
ncbi:MAG TPA: co-chaperone GroES [Actinomycetota bacterium]|jgi:chaperonin GroES